MTVFDGNGNVLETKENEILPGRAQNAYIAGAGTTAEGWLLVESDRPMAGLAFVGTNKSGTNYMFDITLISELATKLHVPHVGQNDTWDTKIFVCNPGADSNDIRIAYVDAEGQAERATNYTIPAMGSGVYQMQDLVGSNKYKDGSVEITAGGGIAAFALYDDLKSGAMSCAGISAIDPTAQKSLSYYLPYFVRELNRGTGVALRNGSDTKTVKVELTVYGEDGAILDTQGEDIAARGQTAFIAANKIPLRGWIRVDSDNPLTGLCFVSTADGASNYMADITLIPEPATKLIVPHVGQNNVWDTTIYICNPSGKTNDVKLAFVASDGSALPAKTFTLPANGSKAYAVADLTGGNPCQKGSVEITSERGVAAFALYDNLKSGGMSYAGISAIGIVDTFANSVGMNFVRIPEGVFAMGSPEDEPHRVHNEIQHQVTLSNGFYMQTTEVTQGQWEAVMGSNPSYFQDCGPDCPVEQVSWLDVQDFIVELNGRDGDATYRLPTEAEWEYAARAGTRTPFAFGGCLSTGQANYNGNVPMPGCPEGEYRETTVLADSFSPNAWGLYFDGGQPCRTPGRVWPEHGPGLADDSDRQGLLFRRRHADSLRQRGQSGRGPKTGLLSSHAGSFGQSVPGPGIHRPVGAVQDDDFRRRRVRVSHGDSAGQASRVRPAGSRERTVPVRRRLHGRRFRPDGVQAGHDAVCL